MDVGEDSMGANLGRDVARRLPKHNKKDYRSLGVYIGVPSILENYHLHSFIPELAEGLRVWGICETHKGFPKTRHSSTLALHDYSADMRVAMAHKAESWSSAMQLGFRFRA